jgi:hypothetical protein
LARLGERSDLRARLHAIAHLQRTRSVHEVLDEFIIDT